MIPKQVLMKPYQEYRDSPTTTSYTLWRLYDRYIEKLVNKKISIGGTSGVLGKGYDLVIDGSVIYSSTIHSSKGKPLNITNPYRDKLSIIHYILARNNIYQVELTDGEYKFLIVIPREESIIPQHLVVETHGDVSLFIDVLSNDSWSYRSLYIEVLVDHGSRFNIVVKYHDTINAPSLFNLGVKALSDTEINYTYVVKPGVMTRFLSSIITSGGNVSINSRGIVLGSDNTRIDNIADYVINNPGSYVYHLFTGLGVSNSIIAQRGLGRINNSVDQSGIEYYSEAMLLSENANAYLQPRLEINTNHVVIAKHAARIKHVLHEQLFYLQTRGIDHGNALKMVIYGYLSQGIMFNDVKKYIYGEVDKLCREKNY